MSDQIQIDAGAFQRRVRTIFTAWKSNDASEDYEQLRQVDSFLVVMGGQNDELMYSKTTALHSWLLGYEFPSTIMLFTKDSVVFVTSASKAAHLEVLRTDKADFKVEILKRSKDEAANKAIWDDLLSKIEAQGKKVGALPKDKPIGKFADEWSSVFDEVKAKQGLQTIDIGPSLSSLWAAKDEEELKSIKYAAKMSSAVMSTYFENEMSGILDEGKKVTHEQLSERVEARLDDNKMWKKQKGLEGADLSLADWCYTPIVQSGGEYDLKTSAVSTSKRLQGADGKGGVVIASMGVKYKNYCSNIGRTYLIDPHKSQQKTYAFLHEVQTELAENHVKAGATCKDIYAKAVELVRAKDEKLAQSFLKNIGFAIGLEFRDSTYVVSARTTRKLKKDMIINLSIGFQDLDDPNHPNAVYSLLLIDTLRVNDGPATFLTDRVRGTNDMAFFFKDEEEDEEVEERRSPVKSDAKITPGGKVLRNKNRGATMDDSAAEKTKAHQKELARQMQEDGLARFAGEDGEGNASNEKVVRRFESYKRENLLPPKVVDLKILVDHRAQSIILPIYGYAVPFHVNTLKNISKSDEGEYTYLRLNFVTPGQIAGKKEDVPFDDPDATFVRSMSYRSTDSARFGELYREITELRKSATKRDAEEKELADVVEQDKLIVSKSRAYTLPEVFPRPALEGKRVPGDLTIHQNGLRFSSPLRPDQRIDLLFSNMKHLFFQPCDKELIVIVHVHLKSPIMIGKRKAKDIQFYREASDVQFDETGNRKRKYRSGDEDEIELEQEERRRRSQLNKEFKTFAERIAEASEGRISVDVPYRELGFSGVPFRTNVLLQPTTDCLVHLTDPPFLVITLTDVEIVHLERVQFGLQSFDMVFVFSDFSRAPMHVTSIPTTSLDDVKQWLDSVDICVTEGAVNLNWGAIMKTVNEDPYDFFVEGGWGFLQADSDEEGSDESESGSEFGSAMDDGDLESEVESESGSDFGDSAASESESGDFEEESDEGEDWDEMERKAARADDKKRRQGASDDEDDGRKSKRR